MYSVKYTTAKSKKQIFIDIKIAFSFFLLLSGIFR